MTYECSRTEEIVNAISYAKLILDPSDYLYCDNVEELISDVEEDLIYSVDYGDVSVGDTVNVSLQIPQEFIEEWIKLKKEYEANEE